MSTYSKIAAQWFAWLICKSIRPTKLGQSKCKIYNNNNKMRNTKKKNINNKLITKRRKSKFIDKKSNV